MVERRKTGRQFEVKPEKITAVVDAARAEILRSMPVGMVRLTMWYRDEANEFKLDKSAAE